MGSVTQTSAGYRCQQNVAVAFAIIREVAFNKETIVKSRGHHNADMGTEALQGVAEECEAGGALHHHEDMVPGGPGGKGEGPQGCDSSLQLPRGGTEAHSVEERSHSQQVLLHVQDDPF